MTHNNGVFFILYRPDLKVIEHINLVDHIFSMDSFLFRFSIKKKLENTSNIVQINESVQFK